MARFGSCDFSELKKFQKNIEKLREERVEQFMKECAKELAARLLAKVIKRTPVRAPESCPSGVEGGTLRRGWTADEASNARSYAKALMVHQYGGFYVIEIINPVEYASYVEFGHRKSNHRGWVRGQFMMTISEQEIEAAAPAVLKRKLMKKLGECFE